MKTLRRERKMERVVRLGQYDLGAAVAASAMIYSGVAQDTQYGPKEQLIPPPTCLSLRGAWEGGYTPCTAQTHGQWLADISHWRMERRILIGYEPTRYEMPTFMWAQSAFMQPQMMVHDRYFYDPVANDYTVDRYLDDMTMRNGGINAVLIRATYPNM